MELLPTERIEELGIDELKIIQDDNLYKFTSDSILLTKFADFRKNEKVADFCSGSGIVGMHYYALHQNVKSVTYFELQTPLAEINKKSVELNGLQDKMQVINTKLQDISSDYNGYFSLILCNPPYKKINSGEQSLSRSIALCRHEIEITQDEIIEIASKKLKQSGRLCMCQRVERFTEMIVSMKKYGLEPFRIQFVSAKESGKIYLCLVESAKITAPELKILPTIEN